MSMNGQNGRIKVKYIGKGCYEFDEGQIVDARVVDSLNDWYVIKGRGCDDEYVFPRELFEVVEG